MIFYLGAVSFLVIACESYTRSNPHTKRPARNNSSEFIYNFVGALIAPVVVVGFFIWGFFAYDWWVPVATLLGCSFVVSRILGKYMKELSTLLVLGAFPIGAACGLIAIMERV